MPVTQYTEDQRDCLQEICNVAMGQAGDALAREFGVFVTLSIPAIKTIEASQLADSLNNFDPDTGIFASIQLFSSGAESDRNHLGGLALMILNEESIEDLSVLMGTSVGDAQDLLRGQTCQRLTQTCLDALAEQWEIAFTSTAPDLSGFEAMNYVCKTVSADWSKVLLVEINYQLEGRKFNGDLLLLFPDEAIESMATRLDALLAD
jgi:chemotaxis protein CheY-P-specific phosphatase CheC